MYFCYPSFFPKLLIVGILFFISSTSNSDWVYPDLQNKNLEWKLPPVSSGKFKFVWERTTSKDNLEIIIQLKKYDCYHHRYRIIDSSKKNSEGDVIKATPPPIWYTIDTNSELLKNLVKYGIC